MRFARDALQWAPSHMIRRVAGRYAGASSDLVNAMDDGYLDNLRELYATDGFHNAYLTTIRSLINPSALLGGNHDVTERLDELKIPVQLIWGANDPLFPVAHAKGACDDPALEARRDRRRRPHAPGRTARGVQPRPPQIPRSLKSPSGIGSNTQARNTGSLSPVRSTRSSIHTRCGRIASIGWCAAWSGGSCCCSFAST